MYSETSFFDSDMVVIPVNCKGRALNIIAKEAKERYPHSFLYYKAECREWVMAKDATGNTRRTSKFQPGDIIYRTEITEEHMEKALAAETPDKAKDLMEKYRKHIVYLPTKNHWKRPSDLGYIKKGMKTFRALLEQEETKVESISIPALGCGAGGLAWGAVRHVIKQALDGIDADYQITLFPPV